MSEQSFHIFLISVSGKTLLFEINPSIRLIDLKRLYAERTGICETKFHFRGAVMYDDEATLAEYGASSGEQIYDIPRMRGGSGILPYDRVVDVSGARVKPKKSLII